MSDASAGDRAVFELTNPNLHDASGEVRLRKEALGIRRDKCLGDDYTETITIQNYLSEAAELVLDLGYAADFADMFVVRGMHPGKRGKLHAARWLQSRLRFRYDGADSHERVARDLHMLSMRQSGQMFFAAGVPWYVALLGRDSLVTSIEMAA